MQRFTTAKFMLGLFIFFGWLVVVAAVIIFPLPIWQTPIWTRVAAFVATCLYGFMIVGIGQMGLAQIATAENTGRMVELLEASLKRKGDPAATVAFGAPKIEPVLTRPRS